jgi:hypothetical protein
VSVAPDITVSVNQMEGFYHVRIIIGLVTGLSVTRVLSGLSKMVQHPGREPVYLPHLIWTFFLLLYVTHFWWFEFALINAPQWQFQTFGFIILYAALIYFLSSLLYPDNLNEYDGYAAYFQSRRGWFYGLLGAIVVMDMADTAMKGAAHLASLGVPYYGRQGLLLLMAVSGPFISRNRVHVAFAVLAISAEIWLIFSRFRFLF